MMIVYKIPCLLDGTGTVQSTSITGAGVTTVSSDIVVELYRNKLHTEVIVGEG